MHTGQSVAQKFTSTTLPRSTISGMISPLIVKNVTAGAVFFSNTGAHATNSAKTVAASVASSIGLRNLPGDAEPTLKRTDICGVF